MRVADTHVLRRTSLKGSGHKFVGRCVKCGAEGLEIFAVNQLCPNSLGLSEEQIVDELFDHPVMWAS